MCFKDKIIQMTGIVIPISIVLNGDVYAVRLELLVKAHVFVGNAKDKRVIRLPPSLTVTRHECDMFKKVLNDKSI